MRNLMKNYFLYILKPSFMMLNFVCNYFYLRHSKFVNMFYFYIYVFSFCMKPFFFFLILFGLMISYKIKAISDILLIIMIVVGIFLGFPIKEFSDYLGTENFNQVTINLGNEYLLDEYMTTHYIVNIFIENIPIVIFVIINNFLLIPIQLT